MLQEFVRNSVLRSPVLGDREGRSGRRPLTLAFPTQPKEGHIRQRERHNIIRTQIADKHTAVKTQCMLHASQQRCTCTNPLNLRLHLPHPHGSLAGPQSRQVRFRIPLSVCTETVREPRLNLIWNSAAKGATFSCRCSQVGTKKAKAAGATLPHGTMRKDSSQAVSRQCLHHLTARHEGGSAAL